jgi:uncharacterized protein with gpF-like domain
MAIDLKPVQPRVAIAALGARGAQLAPSFNWQEIYGELHGTMFTVAKSAGFDVLEDIFAALQAALANGLTYKQFADQLTPILQEKGWWGRKPVVNPSTGLPQLAQLGSPSRLQLILDANMRTAYAAGHWDNFQRNRQSRPYLRYVHLENQLDPRPEHHLWHNTTLPIDHPWWKTHFPPNGWHCHCTVQSLAEADLKTIPGLKFQPPAENLVPWTNKVTGETRLIDKGIDPGWDTNPGQTGFKSVLASLAAKPDPLGIRS